MAFTKLLVSGVRDFVLPAEPMFSSTFLPVPGDFPSPGKGEWSRGPNVLDTPVVFKFSKSSGSALGDKSA